MNKPDTCPHCGYDQNYKGHVNCPGPAKQEEPRHDSKAVKCAKGILYGFPFELPTGSVGEAAKIIEEHYAAAEKLPCGHTVDSLKQSNEYDFDGNRELESSNSGIYVCDECMQRKCMQKMAEPGKSMAEMMLDDIRLVSAGQLMPTLDIKDWIPGLVKQRAALLWLVQEWHARCEGWPSTQWTDCKGDVCTEVQKAFK